MQPITEEQKREALLILSVGCDRATAAHYIGAEPGAVDAAAAGDKAFADAVARAEATAEMAHMRNIQQAAKEDKNWRASVWWLERRQPDRYGRRNPEAVAPGELKRFLLALADAIAEEVCSEEDRRRLLERLRELGEPDESSTGANPQDKNEDGATENPEEPQAP